VRRHTSLTVEILARASGREKVEVGEVVVAKVDRVMMHDATGSISLDVIEELKMNMFDPSKIYIILDHYSPSPSISASNIHRRLREFARREKIHNLFDVGEGICHQLMVEGIVKPGEVIVGADSHTTTYGALSAFATGVGSTEVAYAMITGTLWFRVPEPLYIRVDGCLPPYVSGKDVILKILNETGEDGANYKSMEFFGPGLKTLGMSDRLTIANMSVEGGAKNAIFPLDEIALNYFKDLIVHIDVESLSFLKPIDPKEQKPDIVVDLNSLEPMVAKPHSPANAAPVHEIEGVKIDMAFIGSCTNGRYEDLHQAAKILKGRRVAKDVRLIITPASKKVLMRALEDGLIKIFLEAGAVITPPGCGACFGGHMGIAGDNENIISSSNRNFRGRMGSPKANIYLASPLTVAASAIEGYITDPRKYLR